MERKGLEGDETVPGMRCVVVMEWNGIEWKWNGMGWNGMEWKWNGMEWDEWKWKWNEMEWNCLV